MIAIEGVTKKFKDTCTPAADNVSFTVNKGEFFGLVGESGAGKTTIGKIILGLYAPDEGKVLINGKNITNLSDKQKHKYRKEVGISMVFQHPDASLNPGMTVKQSIKEIKRCIILREIEKYFDDVNLPIDKLDMYPWSLSGGEKRRISLIQALAVKPRILIADELFSGVDSVVRNAMANLLKKMQQEEELTLILISHDMDIVKHLCGKTRTMKNGRLTNSA